MKDNKWFLKKMLEDYYNIVGLTRKENRRVEFLDRRADFCDDFEEFISIKDEEALKTLERALRYYELKHFISNCQALRDVINNKNKEEK